MLNLPSMSKTPMMIMRIPPIRFNVIMCFLSLAKCFMIGVVARDTRINGIASPSEYKAMSETPKKACPLHAAITRTVLSTGPIHGVHLKLKSRPNKKAPRYPRSPAFPSLSNEIVFCLYSCGIVIISVWCRPMIITNIPMMIVTAGW